MVFGGFPVLVVSVIGRAFGALIFRPRSCAFLQFMFSSAQKASLFTFAFSVPVVETAAFEASSQPTHSRRYYISPSLISGYSAASVCKFGSLLQLL